MNTKTSVELTVDENGLIESLEDMFTDNTTFIKEMMQNSRRSGASYVDIKIDLNAKSFSIMDDGAGIQDFAALFSIGKSGWDKEVIEKENPFGIGFASLLFSAKRINIVSLDKEVSFECKDLIRKRHINIKSSKCFFNGCHIFGELSEKTIRSLRASRGIDYIIKEYSCGFPINVFFNHELLESNERIDDEFISCKIGHIKFIDERMVKNVYDRYSNSYYLQGLPIRVNNTVLSTYPGIIHLNSELFRARVPDRDCLIDDSDYSIMIQSCLIDELEHYLTEKFSVLSNAEFCCQYFDICRSFGFHKILDRLTCIPSSLLVDDWKMPTRIEEWSCSVNNDKSDVVYKDEISNYILESEWQSNSCERDDLLKLCIARQLEYSLLNDSGLSSSHWVHDKKMVIPVDYDEIEIDLGEANLISPLGSGHVWGMDNIYDCDVFVIRLLKNRNTVKEYSISKTDVYIDDVGFIINSINADVKALLGQACSYLDEHEIFHEEDYDDDCELFSNFLESYYRRDKSILFKNNIFNMPYHVKNTLRNESFLVIFEEGQRFHVMDINVIGRLIRCCYAAKKTLREYWRYLSFAKV